MASTDTAATPPKQGLSTLVLRNALVLVVAQVAVIPLALVMNFVWAAIWARPTSARSISSRPTSGPRSC